MWLILLCLPCYNNYARVARNAEIAFVCNAEIAFVCYTETPSVNENLDGLFIYLTINLYKNCKFVLATICNEFS